MLTLEGRNVCVRCSSLPMAIGIFLGVSNTRRSFGTLKIFQSFFEKVSKCPEYSTMVGDFENFSNFIRKSLSARNTRRGSGTLKIFCQDFFFQFKQGAASISKGKEGAASISKGAAVKLIKWGPRQCNTGLVFILGFEYSTEVKIDLLSARLFYSRLTAGSRAYRPAAERVESYEYSTRGFFLPRVAFFFAQQAFFSRNSLRLS